MPAGHARQARRPLRALRCLAWLAALLAPALAGAAPAAPPPPATPPARVVSMNLCTDQLAMLLAAPGQLVSVSHLARDPQMSAMVTEAAAYPPNRGRAEEVYLMRPDLVLAGTYDGPPVAMLARLGVPVVTLAPPTSLAETRAAIRTIGRALGRAPAAEAMLAQFDARLARLAHPAGEGAPLAATWGPNGYSAGAESLAGDVLKTAGFALLSERLGMAGSGTVPLETLVLADPALIVTGRRFPGASRAEETLTHPALTHLHARRIEIPDADWACGIPQVLDALATLAEARAALPATAAQP